MAITDREIDQAFSDLKQSCGGVRNDYFGLLYLEEEFNLCRDRAVTQVAFGNNDYGIDGFHFDPERRNLYLFQFKWSESHGGFKDSYQRLIDAGMERIFGAANQDQHANDMLGQLKGCMLENEAVVDRVYVQFVFNGDPIEADRSQVLDKLREDLENKKYLIDGRFGRPVTLVVEHRSPRKGRGGSKPGRKTHAYPVTLEETLRHAGPAGEQMTVGFIRLDDLQAMHREMGQRFFERNIRAALPDTEAVNRSLGRSLKKILLDGQEDPAGFAFNHNGVTLAAEALRAVGDSYTITEPRLLNGAQTVTTYTRFLEANAGHPGLRDAGDVRERLRVMCRIITRASDDYVTTVTVNNNRQNPVEPWNLRANDMIQLQLHDKFHDDLGIYYERQERAFEGLSDEELEVQGFDTHRAIELTRLTRTFLASEGEIDKMGHFRQVFEDDRIYEQVFGENRLRADSRHIVLCYKVQFRLNKLVNAIVEKGANKYAYMQRARNLLWALLCQGILNDAELEKRADQFGQDLSLSAQYTEWLSNLATTKVRFVLSDLVADKAYAEKAAEGNFSFMRTNAAFKRAMDIAHRRWKWVVKRLNK
jgi:hypothetical protein